MKVVRYTIDFVVALLLVAIFLWCAFLFTGAYSQHRISLLINESVLTEIRAEIQNQVKGKVSDASPKTVAEIERLEKAQKNLFDANTISFLFQFVTLLIVTVGAALLGLMYRHYRIAQEDAGVAQRERQEIQKVFGSFVRGRNTAVTLSLKYCFLYTLSQLLAGADMREREKLRIMMSDCQGDIERSLEEAVRERDGLEHVLHELVLDMTDHLSRKLDVLVAKAGDDEKKLIEAIAERNCRCRDLLWANGVDFRQRYDYQWKKMMPTEG